MHETLLIQRCFSFPQEIAKVLNEDPRALRLLAKGVEFAARDDAKTIKEAKLADGDVMHVQVRQTSSTPEGAIKAPVSSSPAIKKDEIPHCILSRDYFDRLFQLLDGPSTIASQVCMMGAAQHNII
jgi:hypothetical protein